MPGIGPKSGSRRGDLPDGDLGGVDTTPPDTPEFRWPMSSDVCKHCTNAGCLDVCPTGAIYRSEFGSVVVQPDVCNGRSEEHTSELQSRGHLVCRLLLAKKNKNGWIKLD